MYRYIVFDVETPSRYNNRMSAIGINVVEDGAITDSFFGKDGEKNYPGIVTSLQMQTYLVITDFARRKNKKGAEYGMPVSILQPPEALWGYETVTMAYDENPEESWERIIHRVEEQFPGTERNEIIKLIGRRPA